MSGCAIAWIPAILLLPGNAMHGFLALLAIFLATAGYSTGTIGQFRLCVLTLCIILCPLIVFSLVKGGLFFNIVAVFSLVYMLYMIGANLRSTKWFKESLQLKLENSLVSYQVNHDLLTGLPNQRLLPQYVDAAIANTKKTNIPFALICFSLNRMEVINDSLGHQAGDIIIKTVASRLNTLANHASKIENGTRYIITISRKDTFNILLVPVLKDRIDNYIQSIFSVLDEHIYVGQRGMKVTASVGFSFYPDDGQDTNSLLMNADSAMLQAKQIGGNRYEFYRKEINEKIPMQLELETDLHDALKKNQLQLYYQPLINIKTGQISGMEALMRWPHPTQGFISPGIFIPVAEETGLIIALGEWSLRQACLQTKYWHQMGYTSLKVAVNLSAKQLREKNLVERFALILSETQYDPNRLELELTESTILDEGIIPIIKEFKNMGLSLAVDDFGTGYSGLSYLKRFSIDKLKIDQSFIRDIPKNNDSMTIVSAIIAMAKELKIRTLAEGVETKEQLEFLVSKGCDYVQGYYFSKPLESASFTQFLSTYRSLSSKQIVLE